MHIDVYVTGQNRGTSQESHRKAHDEKNQGEIPRGAGQKPFLLCSFERVGSFLQDLSDGLDVVLPLSLAADPGSECCLSPVGISSGVTEPSGL